MVAVTRHVLHIEDNPPDVELVRGFLEDSVEETYEVEHHPTLKAALSSIASEKFDVVLLHISRRDGDPTSVINRVRTLSGNVPILVLTGNSDEHLAIEAITAGAQDYLFKSEISSRALRRAIGFSILRRREADLRTLRAALEQYRALSSEASSTSVTARALGVGPLSERMHSAFTELTGGYSRLLKQYVTSQAKGERAPRAPMEYLATRLGDIGAGPKDLIDLHRGALEDGNTSENFRESNSFVMEGRLFALEMMGLLVNYYRVGSRRDEWVE